MTTYRSLIFLLTEVVKAVSPRRLLVCLRISPQPSQLLPKQVQRHDVLEIGRVRSVPVS